MQIAPNSNGINLYFNQIRAYFGQSIADQILNEFLPNSNLYVDKLMLNEWHIYGSSRLGIYKAEVLVASKTLTQSDAQSANGNEPTYSEVEQNPPVLDYASYSQIRGAKNYELSNHLGNVLVVVTDKKTYNCGNTELVNANFDNGSFNNLIVITPNTSMSLSGNKLNVSGTNTQVGTLFNIEGEAGRIFKVDFDLTIGSGISQVWFETNASYNSTGGGLSQNVTNSSSSGHVSFTFTAPQGAYRFKIGGTGTGTYSVDNLIVKEVGPGRYQAEIVTANDYSPFGAPMPGRSFKADNVLVKTTLSTSNFTTGTDGWVATTNATLSNVFGNIRATVTAVNAGMKKTFSTEPGKTYRVMFKINLRGWPYMYIKDKYTNTNLLSITNYIVPGDASYTFTAKGFETDVIFNEASNPTGSIQLANFTLEEVEANSGYRFSFNGKERDNETYGEGNAYDFGARIYDTRLGRFLSTDFKGNLLPSLSVYCFAANSPIYLIDEYGEFPKVAIIITNDDERGFEEHKAALEKQGYKVVSATTGEQALKAMKDLSTPESPTNSLIILSHGSPGGVSSFGGGIWTESELQILARRDWYEKAMLNYQKENGVLSDFSDPNFNRDVYEKAMEGFTDEYVQKTYEQSESQIIQNFKAEKSIITTTDIAKAMETGGGFETKNLQIVLGGCNMAGYVPLDEQVIFSTVLAQDLKSIVLSSQGYTSPDASKNTKTKDKIGTTTPNRTSTGSWIKTDSNGKRTDTKKKTLNLAKPNE